MASAVAGAAIAAYCSTTEATRNLIPPAGATSITITNVNTAVATPTSIIVNSATPMSTIVNTIVANTGNTAVIANVHGARKKASKKPRDENLRECFWIEKTANNMYSIRCRFCNGYKKLLMVFNPTKAREHCVTHCLGISRDLKNELMESSQSYKKQQRMMALIPGQNAMSIGSETLDQIRDNALDTAKALSSPTNKNYKQSGIDDESNFGKRMTEEEAYARITSEVEAVVARGEPLSRLTDQYVVAALLSHKPAIKKWLPEDEKTIYNNFVVPIDVRTSTELTKYMACIPGDINIAFDGVTVNHKQKILYTVSKGQFSVCLTYTDLGSKKHVTSAEVDDAVKICEEAKKTFNAKIASIPVDNAAKHVASLVCAKLDDCCLVLRDPAHCVDLLSKDMAKTNVVKSVLADAKEVYDLVINDRIDSIRREALDDFLIDEECVSKNTVDTRMNLVHDHIVTACKQNEFISSLGTNEKFKCYFNERSNADKEKITSILRRCNFDRWERMNTLTTVTEKFKRIHKLCSRSDFPLSCYVLLVQGLRNGLNVALNADDGKFGKVLGEGAGNEIAEMIRCRFNMDGSDPSGRKVGLLDKFHIWCFICDPFGHEWRSTLKIAGDFNTHVNEMINHFIPLDGAIGSVGSTTTRDKIYKDFMVRELLFCFNYSFIPCII